MPVFKTLPSKIINNLDVTLAILGLAVTSILAILVAIYIGNLVYVVAVTLAALACAGYLAIRKHLLPLTASAPPQVESKSSSRLRIILNILFFLGLTYSLLSYYLRAEDYVRPVSYFVSLVLMVSLLAVELLLLPSNKVWNYFALLKIILIGLSLEDSLSLLYPSVLGIDPWFHQKFTLDILEAGHIPGYSDYAKLPFFHLTVGATSLITGLTYKLATMLSVSLVQVVSDVLFVFLLGRMIYNDKVGLVSALFLSVANQHVWFGYWTIPNTYAAILVLPVLYLLLKTRQRKPVPALSLAVLVMAALILGHTLVAVFMAILLIILWVGFEFYKRAFHERYAVPVTLGIAMLFVVAMFGWWAYASGYLRTLAELIKWGFSIEFLGHPAIEEAASYVKYVPPLEWVFSNLGMLLFFALALIGCFYMVGRRFGNNYSFVIAVSGVLVLVLGYVPLITGLTIITERWHYFAQIALAIPFGVAMVLISQQLLKNGLVKASLMMFLPFLLSALMVLSPQVNMDNRTFTPNMTFRSAFTESEMQAISTISTVWAGKLGMDWYYSELSYQPQLDFKYTTLDMALYSGNFSDCQDLVMLREQIVKYPFEVGGGAIKLNYDPHQALEEQGFSRVYTSASVSGFIKN